GAPTRVDSRAKVYTHLPTEEIRRALRKLGKLSAAEPVGQENKKNSRTARDLRRPSATVRGYCRVAMPVSAPQAWQPRHVAN
ncbi:hypothetical protein, partial [Actinacidiphila oryziradicis]|uniref:hypothetical protein n=1 Tax=Actinacidiphila oryziradicis TaxID=2571141 RepID=UPI0023F33A88